MVRLFVVMKKYCSKLIITIILNDLADFIGIGGFLNFVRAGAKTFFLKLYVN
jgi:hypothetical protein